MVFLQVTSLPPALTFFHSKFNNFPWDLTIEIRIFYFHAVHLAVSEVTVSCCRVLWPRLKAAPDYGVSRPFKCNSSIFTCSRLSGVGSFLGPVIFPVIVHLPVSTAIRVFVGWPQFEPKSICYLQNSLGTIILMGIPCLAGLYVSTKVLHLGRDTDMSSHPVACRAYSALWMLQQVI